MRRIRSRSRMSSWISWLRSCSSAQPTRGNILADLWGTKQQYSAPTDDQNYFGGHSGAMVKCFNPVASPDTYQYYCEEGHHSTTMGELQPATTPSLYTMLSSSCTQETVVNQDIIATESSPDEQHPQFQCDEAMSSGDSVVCSRGLPILRAPSTLPTKSFGSPGQPLNFTLVELFVSGGCSSSATAEADLLEFLEAEPRAPYSPVAYPIAWHVTYWNELGHIDRFSNYSADRRQEWYCVDLEVRATDVSLYTPQVVLNGSSQVVGTKLRGVLEDPERRAAVTMQQNVTIDVSVRQSWESRVVVEPRVYCSEQLLWTLDSDDVLVSAIVVDEGACNVFVGRGCNQGKCLSHINIVASWAQAPLPQFGDEGPGLPLVLDVPRGEIWSTQMALVVVVQDRICGHVLGFWRQPLAPGRQ